MTNLYTKFHFNMCNQCEESKRKLLMDCQTDRQQQSTFPSLKGGINIETIPFDSGLIIIPWNEIYICLLNWCFEIFNNFIITAYWSWCLKGYYIQLSLHGAQGLSINFKELVPSDNDCRCFLEWCTLLKNHRCVPGLVRVRKGCRCVR
jgi:hypothetical protein